jgi:hypothetical protein
MTPDLIIESGMTFGPYDDGYCFYIEKSNTYKTIQEGVQVAEFLLIRTKNGQPSSIWVIEAKSSSPRPENSLDFDEFIDQIKEKLTNGLTLGVAMCLLRHKHAKAELPEPFQNLDLSQIGFRLILVINGHKESWLEPLQNALNKALLPTVKTWALLPTAVVVINDSMARQKGLIRA